MLPQSCPALASNYYPPRWSSSKLLQQKVWNLQQQEQATGCPPTHGVTCGISIFRIISCCIWVGCFGDPSHSPWLVHSYRSGWCGAAALPSFLRVPGHVGHTASSQFTPCNHHISLLIASLTTIHSIQSHFAQSRFAQSRSTQSHSSQSHSSCWGSPTMSATVVGEVINLWPSSFSFCIMHV